MRIYDWPELAEWHMNSSEICMQWKLYSAGLAILMDILCRLPDITINLPPSSLIYKHKAHYGLITIQNSWSAETKEF